MANPFKDIFKRKYTPYYSVEGVDDATKQQIREFGQQLQQDPTRFTEQQAENITTLNYRLDNPIDPDLELYQSIQEGTPGRGAFGQRQTLEDKKLKVTQMAMGKNKERTEDLIAGLQDISEPEPANTLTNVESVIQENQVDNVIEDELQTARQKIKESKREDYIRVLGVDPYKDVVTAFKNWWDRTKQDEEEFEKYVQKYESETELKEAFKKSLEKGTLEKDFNIQIPEKIDPSKEKFEIPTTEALPESTEQDISVPKDFDKVPEASQDMYARGISGVMLKYENVNDSTDLGRNLIKLNNLWAIKYGPRAAKFGAKDSGIPASDGGTWAQWDNEEEMQKGSRAVINEMYFIDAEGNPQRFVLNYILGPNATQEQIIANKDAINNRVKEINNSMAAMDQFEAARQEIESRKDKTEIAQLYTAEDAVKDIWLNPTKYIPMGDLLPYQAQKINYILDIAEKFDTDPSTLSMKELTDFKEYISDKNFKATATWSAQLTEMILQMPAFFGETYGAGKILKYGGKFTKSLKGLTPAKAAERINKILPDNALDKLNLAIKNKKSLQVSSGIAKNVTQAAVGTYISGDVNTATLENFMPGYQFNEDGQVMKIYNGMDKLSAERQAFWSTFIEFGSELTGPAGRKFWDMLKKSPLGEAAANTFIKGYKKLGMPEKEAVMNTAVYKQFKKLNPGVSDNDIDRVFQEFGYHGILEEVFEERVGDASRAFLKKLTDLGIVEGFDNPDWDLKIPTWDQISMELVAFAVPGGIKGTVSAGKKISEARKFKKLSPELNNQYQEAREQNEKEDIELKKIEELENPTEEDASKAEEIRNNKIQFGALEELRDIIIKNPEIVKEVDLSEVNLKEELTLTAQELNEQGVSMEGEGLPSDAEKSTVLGYTVLANQKLKLGLKKGATFDTVLEEYYGLMRRGGLSQEQKDIYDQHYEKYETDADYRQGVNEFINRMHEKMGLEPAVADVNQTLSSDKLFDKEGKSYEYKAKQEPKKDIADKVFDYVGKLFNKAFGRYEIKDEVKDIYKKVQQRKLKVSTAKAIELDKKTEEAPAEEQVAEELIVEKPVAEEKEQEPKKRITPKGISYQLSVKDVGKKLASPKIATEDNKLNIAYAQGLKETIKSIEEFGPEGIHASLNWYGTRIQQTIDLADKELNFETKEDEIFFTTILALQSQATELEINYNTAIHSYKEYKKSGAFTYGPSPAGSEAVISKNIKEEKVVVGGTQLNAVRDNHKKLEYVIEKFGFEKGMNFLLTTHSGKDLRALVTESKIIAAPYYIKAGQEYYGARIFGPKIGNFTANLNGKSDVATYDRWWIRTWGRWMGTPEMTKFSNKEEDMMNEALDNISKALTEATGYKFSKPAVQAVLWYYEKDLYIKNDAKVPQGKDYLESAQARAKEKGYATTPKGTKRARRVTEQRIAKEEADTASLKEGIKKTGKKARQKAPKVSYQLNKPKKVKVKKDKKKGIGKPGVSYQLRDARDEYGISHRPSKEGPPAHDLFEGEMAPDDVYDTPRYYIGSLPKDKVYKETVDAIRYLKSIKGNPEAEVTVYRAGPKKELNNGDWITLSKTYAKEHADSWNTDEGENYKLHEFKVKAKDVLWDMNSLEEWGYYPKEKAKVSYQLTPAQKEFFKDTKVVDSKGNPKVVYHGTTGDFDAFYPGSYFTSNPEYASQMAMEFLEDEFVGQNVKAVYLNIKNPKRYKTLDDYEDFVQIGKTRDTNIDKLKKQGYDGIIYEPKNEDDVIIAFNPNQVKSATAMADKPTKDPRISYQLKPTDKPLNIYNKATGKEKFGKDSKKHSINKYNSTIIPVSTLLKRMDPRLYISLLKFQFNVARKTNVDTKVAESFAKKVEKMKSADKVDFKLAMLNSDVATMLRLIEKYDNKNKDFFQDYQNVRRVLDELREDLISIGEEVGLIDDYFPRKVSDYDDFLKFIYKDKETKSLVENEIRKAEIKKGDVLTNPEKAEIINMIIRGHSFNGSKPSYLKGRKVDKITLDMVPLYRDPITQLMNHISNVVNRIETKKYLGINNKDFEDKTAAEKTSLYEKSVGELLERLMAEEGFSLTPKQQKQYIEILSAYFSFTPSSETYGAVKTITYGFLLGNVTSTITQLQDMAYAIYENNANPRIIKNMAIYLGSRVKNIDRIKRESIGVDIPGIEFQQMSKGNFYKYANMFTNGVFTISGFKLGDGLGKSVLINSTVQKYKAKAQKNRLSKKDKDYLKLLFDKNYDQAIKDLKAKTSPKDFTENELFIAYATILKYQPAGRTEVPLNYIKFGGLGRTFYMLKTFAIKQLNVIRDESFDVIRGAQKGSKINATKNLFYLIGLLMMMGVGKDEIINWMYGKDEEWDELAKDNLLKLFLYSKYDLDKVQRESKYKGVIRSVGTSAVESVISMPTVDFALSLAGDLEALYSGETRRSKLPKYLVPVGTLIHNNRYLSNQLGIGGRGRDDYVYRKLNDLYALTKDVNNLDVKEGKGLNKRQLNNYIEYTLDALNYPQKKLRKGKEVRKINTDKHVSKLRGAYGIVLEKTETKIGDKTIEMWDVKK